MTKHTPVLKGKLTAEPVSLTLSIFTWVTRNKFFALNSFGYGRHLDMYPMLMELVVTSHILKKLFIIFQFYGIFLKMCIMCKCLEGSDGHFLTINIFLSIWSFHQCFFLETLRVKTSLLASFPTNQAMWHVYACIVIVPQSKLTTFAYKFHYVKSKQVEKLTSSKMCEQLRKMSYHYI